ncbi:hypothetical protein HC723_04245 [Vibrio sp. S11_S32]|uniref:hypothetical protein n=1 Tax=Vibrio sp. S11_S32 TaxID=2720225 RepID=UPI001680A173|nr:hypothetical protein [Vibrio sp. S11_S32]MBD1575663.1 hypothetical protein [Vibrio sp. S11_S32]
MKYNLTLVSLNQDQIGRAKEINGPRKKITHALICGDYGQIFGTEKQCRKYYSAWINVFPLIFKEVVESTSFEIQNYGSTFDLVNKLIEIHDPLVKANNPVFQEADTIKTKKKGFLSRFFN